MLGFEEVKEGFVNKMLSVYKDLKEKKGMKFDPYSYSIEREIFETVASRLANTQISLGAIPASLNPKTCNKERLRFIASEQGIIRQNASASRGIINICTGNEEVILQKGFEVVHDGFKYVFLQPVISTGYKISPTRSSGEYSYFSGYIPLHENVLVNCYITVGKDDKYLDKHIESIFYDSVANETRIKIKDLGEVTLNNISYHGFFNYKIKSDVEGADTNVSPNSFLEIKDKSFIVGRKEEITDTVKDSFKVYTDSLGIVGGGDADDDASFRNRIINGVIAINNDNVFYSDFVRLLLKKDWNIDTKRFYVRESEDKEHVVIGALLEAEYPFLNQVLHDEILQYLHHAKPIGLENQNIKLIGLPDSINNVMLFLTLGAGVKVENTILKTIARVVKSLNKTIKYNEDVNNITLSMAFGNLRDDVTGERLDNLVLNTSSFQAVKDKLTQIEKVVIGKNTYKIDDI